MNIISIQFDSDKKTLLIKEDDSLYIWSIIIVVAFPHIFGTVKIPWTIFIRLPHFLK